MCPSGQKRDAHIRDGRSGQYTRMLLFLYMGKDQPLPVAVQYILLAGRADLNAAAPLPRLQEQMNLRVMAQRLIVSDTLHGSGDRLLVYNMSFRELHFLVETLPDQCFQYLRLYFAHKLHMDLPRPLIPDHMQQRVFLLQLPQLAQKDKGIACFRQHETAMYYLINKMCLIPQALKPLAYL